MRVIRVIGVVALLSVGVCLFVSWWYWPLPAMLGVIALLLWYGAYSHMKGALHLSRGKVCYRCGRVMHKGLEVACVRCGHLATEAERTRIEAIATRQIWW